MPKSILDKIDFTHSKVFPFEGGIESGKLSFFDDEKYFSPLKRKLRKYQNWLWCVSKNSPPKGSRPTWVALLNPDWLWKLQGGDLGGFMSTPQDFIIKFGGFSSLELGITSKLALVLITKWGEMGYENFQKIVERKLAASAKKNDEKVRKNFRQSILCQSILASPSYSNPPSQRKCTVWFQKNSQKLMFFLNWNFRGFSLKLSSNLFQKNSLSTKWNWNWAQN